MLSRRDVLAAVMASVATAGAEREAQAEDLRGKVMTVRGPIAADRMGLTLPHEHILVDFIGADKTGPHRWDADEVFAVMKPHLNAAKASGVGTFVDCTPAYLGRDPRLLHRLSEATGLHILTTTGYYKEPYLPPHAFTESADELAARWIAEWEKGIEGTSIRPGLIKIAVNPGPLLPVQQKIVRAAARASKRTGLVIACHTGHGPAALEVLDILRDEKLPLARWIFVHADAEADRKFHVEVAKAGAWVEYDAIGWKPVAEHVKLVTAFLAEGLAYRLLLSHDAGWYHAGEPKGGEIKPFTPLVRELWPLLEREGVKQEMRRKLLFDNSRRAFALTPP